MDFAVSLKSASKALKVATLSAALVCGPARVPLMLIYVLNNEDFLTIDELRFTVTICKSRWKRSSLSSWLVNIF